MQGKRRPWWPIVKGLIGLAILVFIARRFAQDLSQPELYQEPIALGWLVAAGGLYVLGLGCACAYWGWLMGQLGPRPRVWPVIRAYFVSHLGKYVPGKALTLVMRAALGKDAGVAPGLAGMTAFYEVLLTMGAGVLLAAIYYLAMAIATPTIDAAEARAQAWAALIRLQAPEKGFAPRALFIVAIALAIGILWPTIPPIFNRLADKLSLPFRDPSRRIPRLTTYHMLGGLVFGAVGWLFLGGALACALHAVDRAGLAWDLPTFVRVLSILAIAYVAGFIVLLAPAGIGVRELFLTWLLTPEIAAAHDLPRELAEGKVVLVVLLLRLTWTVAEVVLAGLFYRWRGRVVS